MHEEHGDATGFGARIEEVAMNPQLQAELTEAEHERRSLETALPYTWADYALLPLPLTSFVLLAWPLLVVTAVLRFTDSAEPLVWAVLVLACPALPFVSRLLLAPARQMWAERAATPVTRAGRVVLAGVGTFWLPATRRATLAAWAGFAAASGVAVLAGAIDPAALLG